MPPFWIDWSPAKPVLVCFPINNIPEKISSFWLVKSSFFFFNSAEKSYFSAKRGNKSSIVIGQWSKKFTDGQWNIFVSNQAHALDGAIDGVIFPDCVIRVPSFCLTISNFFIYIINNYSLDFSYVIWNKQALVNFSKTPDCTRPAGSCNFISLWKIYSKLHLKSCD